MLDHSFPLLSPKDSESLIIFDIRFRNVGAKRPLNGTSKVNRQTDRRTDRRIFWLIESIGPEGICFEKSFGEKKIFLRKVYFWRKKFVGRKKYWWKVFCWDSGGWQNFFKKKSFDNFLYFKNQNECGGKKSLVKRSFLWQKNCWLKKIYDRKSCGRKSFLGEKMFLVEKVFGIFFVNCSPARLLVKIQGAGNLVET